MEFVIERKLWLICVANWVPRNSFPDTIIQDTVLFIGRPASRLVDFHQSAELLQF